MDISKLFLKSDPLTQTQYKLCPYCINYNIINIPRCHFCFEEIPSYDKDSFWTYRNKNLQFNEDSTLGFSTDNKTSSNLKVQDLFADQSQNWNSLIDVADFLNQYSMRKIDVNDLWVLLLKKFPLDLEILKNIEQLKINLDLPQKNCKEMLEKFVEIEKKDPTKIFADTAAWLSIYTHETRNEVLEKNLHWLNVSKGYYYNYRNVIHIDEADPQQVTEALQFLPNMNASDFSAELSLFPLHWKFLSSEVIISKERYSYLLKGWSPKSKQDQAWRDLGLFYCKKGDLKNSSILEYRDQELAKDFNKRDNNFLFSYLIITDDKENSILDFPYKFDSYYAPLVNSSLDKNFIHEFFLHNNNLESFTRGLSFFNFSNTDIGSQVAHKLITTLSENDCIRILKQSHLSLQEFLFREALQNKKTDLCSNIFDHAKNKDSLLKALSALQVDNSNATFMVSLIGKLESSVPWPEDLLLNILNCESLKNNDFETILRQLKRNLSHKSKCLLSLYKLWIKTQSEIILSNMGSIFNSLGDDIFDPKKSESDKDLSSFQSLFKSKFLSSQSADVKLTEKLVDAYVDIRSLKLTFFTDKSEDSLLCDSLISFLKDSQSSRLQKISFNLLYALLQQDRLAGPEKIKITDNLPLFDSEYREQLRLKL